MKFMLALLFTFSSLVHAQRMTWSEFNGDAFLPEVIQVSTIPLQKFHIMEEFLADSGTSDLWFASLEKLGVNELSEVQQFIKLCPFENSSRKLGTFQRGESSSYYNMKQFESSPVWPVDYHSYHNFDLEETPLFHKLTVHEKPEICIRGGKNLNVTLQVLIHELHHFYQRLLRLWIKD